MTVISRAEWGARPSKGSGNKMTSPYNGCVIHYDGGVNVVIANHDQCTVKVRSIQNYHMDHNGWVDIPYSFLVCPHGRIFEGRGLGRGNAANGNNVANATTYAIYSMIGGSQSPTAEMVQGLKDAVKYCRDNGAGTRITKHSDWQATSCPGSALTGLVDSGSLEPGAVVPPAPPAPAPGAPAFPLPDGWYFGPKSGPNESVSGYYSHREDLRTWQQRMKTRGWGINPDGLYGPETERVARQFQAEKGLAVDGLIGVNTWNAAWTAPIS